MSCRLPDCEDPVYVRGVCSSHYRMYIGLREGWMRVALFILPAQTRNRSGERTANWCTCPIQHLRHISPFPEGTVQCDNCGKPTRESLNS